MIIGFLGFGEVASTLSAGFMDKGADVYTCVLDRSTRTKESTKKTGVKLYESYKELAENSDILISSVVPSNAVEVAGIVGKYSTGIYVDMNNVSPKTVRNALGMIENGRTVDAAIMGSVARNGFNVKVIASGPFANEFSELKVYGLNVNVVGSENGQASGIKLLRSAYTKGVSALLFESIYSAYKMGLDREVLEYISETEGNEFLDSAVSRIISSSIHADRRSQEMEEVVEMLSEKLDPIMCRATLQFFKSLTKDIKKPKKRPNNYLEVFKLYYGD